jgi:hypothetical protein
MHRRSVLKPEIWTAIFTGVLAFVTGFALIYAHGQITEMREGSRRQISEARDEARIQHLVTFVNQFDQEPLASYRKTLALKRLRNESDPPELYRVLDFFETIATLTQRGYLNETDVWKEFGYWILHLDADPEVKEDLDWESKNRPNEYPGFIQLLGSLRSIDLQHNGKGADFSLQEVKEFYAEESQIVAGAPAPKHAASRETVHE